MTRAPLDMRVLGALRFVDSVTNNAISAPLSVTAPDVRFIRNRRGLYVIAEAAGTVRYSGEFELPVPPVPPIPPIVGSVSIKVTVVDPQERYLPRSATVSVPRDPDVFHKLQPSSLFQPVDVVLFPSPTMPIATGWATLRLSVKRFGSMRGLPFAFVRVLRASNNAVLARGLADERGEALVAIPGIPITTWNVHGHAAVTTSAITAHVAACFDARAFDPATNTFPDPGALEQAFSTLPHSSDLQLDLASGHEEARRIDVTVPP